MKFQYFLYEEVHESYGNCSFDQDQFEAPWNIIFLLKLFYLLFYWIWRVEICDQNGDSGGLSCERTNLFGLHKLYRRAIRVITGATWAAVWSGSYSLWYLWSVLSNDVLRRCICMTSSEILRAQLTFFFITLLGTIFFFIYVMYSPLYYWWLRECRWYLFLRSL